MVAALTKEAVGSQETELEADFHFSPAVLGIERDTTVELAVWATDHMPGREPSRTQPIQLHILGTEDHAEMVRQKLEEVLQDLEEVSRTEENIAEDTRELSKSDDDTLAKRKTKRRKTVASTPRYISFWRMSIKAIRAQQQISHVNDMLGSHVIVLSVISEFSCLH